MIRLVLEHTASADHREAAQLNVPEGVRATEHTLGCRTGDSVRSPELFPYATSTPFPPVALPAH